MPENGVHGHVPRKLLRGKKTLPGAELAALGLDMSRYRVGDNGALVEITMKSARNISYEDNSELSDCSTATEPEYVKNGFSTFKEYFQFKKREAQQKRAEENERMGHFNPLVDRYVRPARVQLDDSSDMSMEDSSRDTGDSEGDASDQDNTLCEDMESGSDAAELENNKNTQSRLTSTSRSLSTPIVAAASTSEAETPGSRTTAISSQALASTPLTNRTLVASQGLQHLADQLEGEFSMIGASSSFNERVNETSSPAANANSRTTLSMDSHGTPSTVPDLAAGTNSAVDNQTFTVCGNGSKVASATFTIDRAEQGSSASASGFVSASASVDGNVADTAEPERMEVDETVADVGKTTTVIGPAPRPAPEQAEAESTKQNGEAQGGPRPVTPVGSATTSHTRPQVPTRASMLPPTSGAAFVPRIPKQSKWTVRTSTMCAPAWQAATEIKAPTVPDQRPSLALDVSSPPSNVLPHTTQVAQVSARNASPKPLTPLAPQSQVAATTPTGCKSPKTPLANSQAPGGRSTFRRLTYTPKDTRNPERAAASYQLSERAQRSVERLLTPRRTSCPRQNHQHSHAVTSATEAASLTLRNNELKTPKAARDISASDLPTSATRPSRNTRTLLVRGAPKSAKALNLRQKISARRLAEVKPPNFLDIDSSAASEQDQSRGGETDSEKKSDVTENEKSMIQCVIDDTILDDGADERESEEREQGAGDQSAQDSPEQVPRDGPSQSFNSFRPGTSLRGVDSLDTVDDDFGDKFGQQQGSPDTDTPEHQQASSSIDPLTLTSGMNSLNMLNDSDGDGDMLGNDDSQANESMDLNATNSELTHMYRVEKPEPVVAAVLVPRKIIPRDEKQEARTGRPQRNRMKPAREWLGEQAIYENSPSGGKRLVGVSTVTVYQKDQIKYGTADVRALTFKRIEEQNRRRHQREKAKQQSRRRKVVVETDTEEE